MSRTNGSEEKQPVDAAGPDEKVRQAFLRVAKADLEGKNAADYVADKKEWLRTGDPKALPAMENRWQATMRIGMERIGQAVTKVRSLRQMTVPDYLKAALNQRQQNGSVANFSGGRDRFEKLGLFMPLTNRTPAPDTIFLPSATDPSGSCASVQCLSASPEPTRTI